MLLHVSPSSPSNKRIQYSTEKKVEWWDKYHHSPYNYIASCVGAHTSNECVDTISHHHHNMKHLKWTKFSDTLSYTHKKDIFIVSFGTQPPEHNVIVYATKNTQLPILRNMQQCQSSNNVQRRAGWMRKSVCERESEKGKKSIGSELNAIGHETVNFSPNRVGLRLIYSWLKQTTMGFRSYMSRKRYSLHHAYAAHRPEIAFDGNGAILSIQLCSFFFRQRAPQKRLRANRKK